MEGGTRVCIAISVVFGEEVGISPGALDGAIVFRVKFMGGVKWTLFGGLVGGGSTAGAYGDGGSMF